MKKIFQINLTLIICGLCLFSLIPNGIAWYHGNPVHEPFANEITTYNEDHYGTPDWFADQVVNQIGYTESNYQTFWLDIYREYYLFGTELIEYNSNEVKLYINGTYFEYLDLDTVIRFNSLHQYTAFNSEYYLDYILNQFSIALQSLNFDTASIYLGMYASLFSYSTYFPNFKIGESFPYTNSDHIEWNIAYDIYEKSQTTFFESMKTKINQSTMTSSNAFQSSSKQTYFGSNQSINSEYNASKLFELYPIINTNVIYWEQLDANSYRYYNQLKTNFKIAIDLCATVLYSIIKNVNIKLLYPLNDPNPTKITTTTWLIVSIILICCIPIIGLFVYLKRRMLYDMNREFFIKKKRIKEFRKEQIKKPKKEKSLQLGNTLNH